MHRGALIVVGFREILKPKTLSPCHNVCASLVTLVDCGELPTDVSVVAGRLSLRRPPGIKVLIT
ncbi:hypothetical protein CRYUN_Cryun30bG0098900 [Craigia yunnanensis]